MARSSRETLQNVKLRTLRYIAQRVRGGGRKSVACLSLRTIAADLELSTGRVLSARRYLIEEGLIVMEHRQAENGGTIENAYRVTRRGFALIKRLDTREQEALQEAKSVE